MGALRNLKGNVFGRWTVLRRSGSDSQKHPKPMWLCRCECGKVARVIASSLVSGKSKSCGCGRIDSITKHECCDRDEYSIWSCIKQRCTNRNCSGFSSYGGKGITMCDRWLNSFKNFFADMGVRPSKKHSIDRFPKKEGNYEPGNCRWATTSEQAANKRNVILYTHNGQTMHLNDWAKHLGVCRSRIAYRIQRGLDFSEAISMTILHRRSPETGKLISMTP